MKIKILDRLVFNFEIVILAIAMVAMRGLPQSVPPLINYQGRLTDQTGSPLAAGLYTLQFRLWDSPTATNAIDLIWGQQQNVAVQPNGVFNVILGSPGGTSLAGPIPQVNNLAYAFSGSSCYLGIAVATSNSVPILNPIEIFPRQQLLSVPYAFSASSARIAAAVLPGSITTTSLTPGLIQTTNIAGGAVTLGALAPRQVGTNVGVGGLAMSVGQSTYQEIFAGDNGGSPVEINGLSLTITTSGRPLVLTLVAAPLPDSTNPMSGLTYIQSYGNNGKTDAGGNLIFYEDGNALCNYPVCSMVVNGGGANYIEGYSSGTFTMVAFPTPGSHTYHIKALATYNYINIFGYRLMAYEL